MLIDIWRVPAEGETRTGILPGAILGLENEADIVADTPVRYDVRITVCDNELIVAGRVATEIQFLCSRCAERFRAPVADDHFEVFIRCENKFSSVDLTPDIREAILLAFPTHPVCAATCLGLCATCGANLNTGGCNCVKSDRDGCWSVLDKLQLKAGGSHGRSKKKKVKK